MMLGSVGAKVSQRVLSLDRFTKEESPFVPEVSTAASEPLEVSHSTTCLVLVCYLLSRTATVLFPLKGLGLPPKCVTALFEPETLEVKILIMAIIAVEMASDREHLIHFWTTDSRSIELSQA
jgi:hypothetical protein